jgi:hypothetical protein
MPDPLTLHINAEHLALTVAADTNGDDRRLARHASIHAHLRVDDAGYGMKQLYLTRCWLWCRLRWRVARDRDGGGGLEICFFSRSFHAALSSRLYKRHSDARVSESVLSSSSLQALTFNMIL